MTRENKPNTGALFKNANKKADNHPDYRGPFYDADGREMEISAWLNVSKKGDKYMSLQVREKFVPNGKPAEKPADLDDEIPFAWAIAAPVAGLLAAALMFAEKVVA